MPEGVGENPHEPETDTPKKQPFPERWRAFKAATVESSFRNTGVAYRNLLSFLLGFIAAVLALTTQMITPAASAWVFGGAVFAVVVAFLTRPFNKKRADPFRWGLITILILGFGFGALVVQYREWFKWLWTHVQMINTPDRVLLASLFLLGVIMGFFVVRNWSKEQREFVTSLTAVFGGAFVATILGELTKDSELTPLKAFALYAGGFTLSGSLNLITSALLVANYTNKHSLTSRAVIDFLYGSDKAEAIDKYFLKNFKQDPVYVRRLLTDAVKEYRNIIKREFAAKMQLRFERRQKELGKEPSIPSHYYQLLSIKCEGEQESDGTQPYTPEAEREYVVTVQEVKGIEPEMFRVGVTARFQDRLEYIVAPGQYRKPFPYHASVAGLALLSRKTIVMDRDIDNRFRAKQYPQGRCPKEVEQTRGLDEIDFLSYISIPVVSRLSKPGEIGLGVVNVDTKLFVTDTELQGDKLKTQAGVYEIKLKRRLLTDYANNLYEPNDEYVKHLTDLTEIMVPVLELYLYCRTGATSG